MQASVSFSEQYIILQASVSFSEQYIILQASVSFSEQYIILQASVSFSEQYIILQASEKIFKYPFKQFFVLLQDYNLRLDFCYELIEDCG